MRSAKLKIPSAAILAGLFLAGTLSLHAQAPTPTGGAGTRPVAVLFCQYADKPNTYGVTPASVLATTWLPNNVMLNGATVDNSISGLVQDASLGTISLQGTQAFGWFTLPNPMSSYAAATDVGSACIAAAQQNGVNLMPFTYVAIYMNDALPGIQALSWRTALPGPPSPTPFNTLVVNQWGLTSPPLVIHELGHILSSGGQHTDSCSDPLGGAGYYGGNVITDTPPVRMSAVSPEWDASRRELMGFIPTASMATFSGGTQTYNISRLTQPLPGLLTAVDVPLPNGAKYVISARTQIGYDSYTVFPATPYFTEYAMPREGVMIELLTSTQVDAHVEMSNPGGDCRGADSIWLTGQTYTDAANGISINVVNFNSMGNPTAQIVVSSGAKPAVYQVNSGGGAAAPFVADAYYSAAGNTFSTGATIDTSAVTNPAPQAVYQTERFGNLTYTFPKLTAGATYKIRLHFAEIYWTAAGQRTFNVSINGTQLLTNFDIFATAGAQNKALVKEFNATANASGQIVIQYTSLIDNAKSSGIEIIPQ